MDRELRALRWVLMVMAIVVMAAWVFGSLPCHITNGVTYCSFHDRAEDLHDAWKSFLNGW